MIWKVSYWQPCKCLLRNNFTFIGKPRGKRERERDCEREKKSERERERNTGKVREKEERNRGDGKLDFVDRFLLLSNFFPSLLHFTLLAARLPYNWI